MDKPTEARMLFMIKILVSISGGRTSAYMAYMLKTHKSELAEFLKCEENEIEFIYVFANTGQEHEDTLRFLNDVDKYMLDNQIVWVEGVAQHDKRVSTQHNVVTYETCHKNDQYELVTHPFHDHIIKYGIPNTSYKNCSRELKRNAINSYMKSTGWHESDDTSFTAIGIRDDEKRRVAKAASARNIIYPLVDLFPCDKQDVIDWWKQFEYDLTIPEWQGNCVTCYKKSAKKLTKIFQETPGAYYFNKFMEAKYSRVGPEFEKHIDPVPRAFFRGRRTANDMIAYFTSTETNVDDYIDIMNDAGCSESCEIYETDSNEEN